MVVEAAAVADQADGPVALAALAAPEDALEVDSYAGAKGADFAPKK